MTRRTTLVRGGLLAAAAALALGTATSQATARQADSGNWLYVTVTHGDARSGEQPGRLLTCDPPQGHTKAAEACAQLDAVDGDIHRLEQHGTYCPMVYAPVTARARGEWNGHPIDYRETFANSCGMTSRTGAVFTVDA